ncbi:MAG: hypothetical protein NTY75_01010 [Candidatus Shapirobacteria bacterium]|nr:hypothetical protein [Candidatus Shapirobacteria bacterium]
MFKYCFQPVNLADTEKLLLEVVFVTAVQTLFLTADTGVAVENKNIGTNAKNNIKTFPFIKIIITLIMTLKRILIVIVLAILVGTIATYYILKPKPVSPNTTEITSISPTPIPVALSTWTDEAGFSFQYPTGTLIDKHPEDTTNYANLTLTLPSQNTVNIIMADNTFKDLLINTTLGGKPAKKVIKDGVTTVTCIDNEVLVTITGQDISGIVDSWAFIYPTKAVTKTSTSSDNSSDVLEEE